MNGMRAVALPRSLILKSQNKANVVTRISIGSAQTVGFSNGGTLDLWNRSFKFMHRINDLLSGTCVSCLLQPNQPHLMEGRSTSIPEVGTAEATHGDQQNRNDANENTWNFHK